MKKTLFTAGIFFSLCAQAQTNYPTGISDCIGRWNFTSAGAITTLPDVSGNNNNGTTYNLVSAIGFRNAPNKAMQFDGFSSYARIADNALLQPQRITMLALVNLDTFYANTCQNVEIIGKGASSFISGKYGIGINDNIYDNGNCFSYNPNYMQLAPPLHTSSYTVPLGNYVDLHNWYLFLVTYDSITVELYQVLMDTNNYVNNVAPIATLPFSVPLGTNTDDFIIGKMDNIQYPYWLTGRLDEVALFNRAIDNNEVQDIYDYLWGKVVINKPFTDTVVCSGGTIVVPYSVSDNFPANNIFNVELSSSSGSFSNPVIIGTLSSNVSGSISCTIPANTPLGNGYRVRIVPSNPALTSRDNGKNIAIIAPDVPAVLISASPNNIVTGQPVTFTAFVNNGGTAPTYQWKKNSLVIPGVTNSQFTTSNISGNDTISAVVYSNAPCVYPDSAESNKITMIATDISNTLFANTEISIYPNPSTGAFFIKGNIAKKQTFRFQLSNSIGQILGTEQILVNEGGFERRIFKELRLSHGLYFIRILGDETIKTVPVVVQH